MPSGTISSLVLSGRGGEGGGGKTGREPVGNDGLGELFISHVKSDGVTTSISTASHEEVRLVFMCVSSGSAFGVLSASVGGRRGLSCFCCAGASLFSVPLVFSTPEDSGQLEDAAA